LAKSGTGFHGVDAFPIIKSTV